MWSFKPEEGHLLSQFPTESNIVLFCNVISIMLRMLVVFVGGCTHTGAQSFAQE